MAFFVGGALVSVISVLRFQALMQEVIDDLPNSVKRQQRYSGMLEDPRYSNALYFDLLFKKLDVAVGRDRLRKARRWFLGAVTAFIVLGIAITILTIV